jgi:hypothetical protein
VSRTVYSVTNWWPEDGTALLGLFTTREDAEKYAADLNAKAPPTAPDYSLAGVSEETLWESIEEAREDDARRVREEKE